MGLKVSSGASSGPGRSEGLGHRSVWPSRTAALGIATGPRVWGDLPPGPHLLALPMTAASVPLPCRVKSDRRDFIGSTETSTATLWLFIPSQKPLTQGSVTSRVQRGQAASGSDRCGEPGGRDAKQTATRQQCPCLAGKRHSHLAAATRAPDTWPCQPGPGGGKERKSVIGLAS